MTCSPIKLPDGTVAIVCIRGERPRYCRCGRRATLLCDYPLAGKKAGGTCSAPLCTRCARAIGEDRHLCPIHHQMNETRPRLPEQGRLFDEEV